MYYHDGYQHGLPSPGALSQHADSWDPSSSYRVRCHMFKSFSGELTLLICGPLSETRGLKAASGTIGSVPNLSIYWNIEKQGLCQQVEYIVLPLDSKCVVQPALSNAMSQTRLRRTYRMGLSPSCSCYHVRSV